MADSFSSPFRVNGKIQNVQSVFMEFENHKSHYDMFMPGNHAYAIPLS